MPQQEAAADRRPTALALLLIIAGLIGLAAAFALTLDKIELAGHPHAQLSCNINPLIGCSDGLKSWQGNLAGFSNTVFGLMWWPAPVAVGTMILAGARFRRWFWRLFALGTTAAMALVVFLIWQSLYSLAVLCPWCMLTWAATIPIFFATVLHVLGRGHLPAPRTVRMMAAEASGWLPLITLLAYVLVAVVAQTQLHWLPNAFI